MAVLADLLERNSEVSCGPVTCDCNGRLPRVAALPARGSPGGRRPSFLNALQHLPQGDEALALGVLAVECDEHPPADLRLHRPQAPRDVRRHNDVPAGPAVMTA